MKTLKVKKGEFINWYLEDYDPNLWAEDIYAGLIEVGEYRLTLEDLKRFIGYLPLRLILNPKVIDKKDVEDEEIIEPTEKYKIKFV